MAGKMKKTRFLLLWIGLVCGACANIYTARGVYHRVRPGETLFSLATRYRIPPQDLAELNNLEDPTELKVGKSLFVPGVKLGKSPYPWPHLKGKLKISDKPRYRNPNRIEVDHGRFSWPIRGGVSSGFGMRHGRRHDGIDIRSPRGTPIRAAQEGTVVYSRRMRGYGNLILLKHSDNFFTVYAHNSVNLVKNGTRVKRGQVIAKVGSTGRATGPHLHFEVREGSKARNPLFFLPKR